MEMETNSTTYLIISQTNKKQEERWKLRQSRRFVILKVMKDKSYAIQIFYYKCGTLFFPLKNNLFEQMEIS